MKGYWILNSSTDAGETGLYYYGEMVCSWRTLEKLGYTIRRLQFFSPSALARVANEARMWLNATEVKR